ncbi:MAG TPA: amidohydrolase family protein [Thermoanaerobaculia bacterium]|nr:amidohydrolase family protein [Thermoanaerobaculia bacterium]
MLKRALLLLVLALPLFVAAEEKGPAYAPDRRAGEGEGPFKRLIIRGATVIDGTGAPPIGPMDVVIEGNRIVAVQQVGFPKVAIDAEGRPKDASREIDGSKMYVLPGFVDMHGHAGGVEQGTTAEYVFKLWLAHGITTVREPGSGNGLEWTIHERDRSAKNEIVAPRIFPYVFTGASMWSGGPINSPEQARKFVQWAAKGGGAGIKIIGGTTDPVYDPEILAAIIDEAHKLKLGTTTHLAQMGVARMNILQASRLGLDCMEHWYGLPESLFADRTIQDYPPNYNYADEQNRFGEAGRLWRQAAPPGSAKWNAVMDELLQRGFTIDPTFTIYEASRDLMRAMNAEWHQRYTLPSLWKWYEPNRKAHGAYWFDWTTRDEIEWRNNYRLWMAFVNEYKNRGGRVTTGSDSGYIYKLYGFDYIRELELLQEAGFHPLEVIRSATYYGAEAIAAPTGKKAQFGLVRPGMLADLVLVEENPLANLKVLYGTGAVRVNDETGKVERVGGVKYVIKDGIVYDAKQLLADVEKIVTEAKKAR